MYMFHGEQVSQIHLGIYVVRDFPFAEESREVRLQLCSAGNPHPQLEQALQVVLDQRQVMSVQTLLPQLLLTNVFIL